MVSSEFLMAHLAANNPKELYEELVRAGITPTQKQTNEAIIHILQTGELLNVSRD